MHARREGVLVERTNKRSLLIPSFLAYLDFVFWRKTATPFLLHLGSVRAIPSQPALSRVSEKLDIPTSSFPENARNSPFLAIVSDRLERT